jgi:hypothetical protein
MRDEFRRQIKACAQLGTKCDVDGDHAPDQLTAESPVPKSGKDAREWYIRLLALARLDTWHSVRNESTVILPRIIYMG